MASISKEQKQKKISVLLDEIKSFETEISNQPNIPKNVLTFLERIKDIAKSQREVLRLSEMVTMYRLSDEKDLYFKSLLRKELYKIYVI